MVHFEGPSEFPPGFRHVNVTHCLSDFVGGGMMYSCSSGTSAGERKLMPTIEDEWERRSLLYSLLMPVMSQYEN